MTVVAHLSSADAAEIERLEETLWRADTRYDPVHMEAVLHSDFHEFGRSGRRYTRDQCIAITSGGFSADLPLTGFSAALVAPGVVLATYLGVVHYDTTEVSNRSSLWVSDGLGWRLRFHQGTPTDRPS